MAEFVSKWGHIEFPEPLEMVRRDNLKPGDVAWSSHYGKRTVEKVSVRGTEGQTTYITWETPQGAPHPFSEAYPSEGTIPLVSRAVPAVIATASNVSATRPINPIHDYALTLMTHVVQEQVNGGTDWYEVAAFTSQDAAEDYAQHLNTTDPKDLPYVVSHIGTRHGNPDEEH